ncbi:hypothetical protein [Helicobacter sp. T3_23-1056]
MQAYFAGDKNQQKEGKMLSSHDLNIMTAYLKSKGYTKEQIASMNDKQILKDYEEKSKEFIYQAKKQIDIIPQSQKNELHKEYQHLEIPIELAQIIEGDNVKIYEMLDEYIENYTVREVAETIFMKTKKTKIAKLEKMMRIKRSQLQEVWLESLERNLSTLPTEEAQTLLKFYYDKKDNLIELKNIYTRSNDKKYLQQIYEIASMKLHIVRDYMPKELEDTYRVYYDNSQEKISLIKQILKMSNGFEKGYLLGLSIHDLGELFTQIQEDLERKRKEEEEVKMYFDEFKDALHSTKEEMFLEVCIDAASALPRERFQELCASLAKKYKTFRHRFSDIARHHKEVSNLQIVF